MQRTASETAAAIGLLALFGCAAGRCALARAAHVPRAALVVADAALAVVAGKANATRTVRAIGLATGCAGIGVRAVLCQRTMVVTGQAVYASSVRQAESTRALWALWTCTRFTARAAGSARAAALVRCAAG